MGYHRAGFEVWGIDTKPQPDYPFRFNQGDAFEWLDGLGQSIVQYFDLIHASPPCQAFSITGNLARAQGKQASTVDLLTPLRPLLEASGLPYIIENVRGAPLHDPLTLCGSTFNLGVRRHRLFESNLPLVDHGPCRHKEQGRPIGVYHVMGDSIPQGGKTAETLEEGQQAMGIDWMPWKSLKEAIPPEYTLWLGRQAACVL
jgi:DNA (cytosine-5)-methyltransferase 1